MTTVTDFSPPCPYCHRNLGRPDYGWRWCVHCMMWIKEDGTKLAIEEAKEIVNHEKDFD